MKTLIVEDDFTSRLLMQEMLKPYGTSHVAINGKEAVEAVNLALGADDPYNLICLDIMLPEMDGQAALKEIRTLEEDHGITSSKGAKIIMTTALGDMDNIKKAFSELCDAYLVKPIDRGKMLDELQRLKLIP